MIFQDLGNTVFRVVVILDFELTFEDCLKNALTELF